VVTRAAHNPGPIERAAMAVPVEDEKQRVLLAIARFADEGRDDPSINQIHRRASVHWMAAVIKTEKLAREGWISITKPTAPSGERARYALHLPAPQTIKEITNTMTTKTHIPILKTDVLPSALKTNWLPAMKAIDWPTYKRYRDEHEAAVAEFVASAGDVRAEAESLRRICDLVEVAAVQLPSLIESEGQQALQKRREELESIGRESDPPPLASGVSVAEVRARSSNNIAGSGPLDGVDLRELGLAARADESALGEMSTYGSGSRIARGLECLPEVRRLVREALVEGE
jgi:hypothetical protein